MRPLDAAPFPHFWYPRAAAAGVLACGLGAILCTSRYVALPRAMEQLDWSRMPLAIALFVLLGGIAVGVCLGGCTLLAARRGARVPGLMAAGAFGGALAGVAPGIMGIAGFGSLHAPYAGTANILSSILLAAITFVALWSPLLYPQPHVGAPLVSRARHLGQAAIASVIALGAFGMLAWTVLRTLGWVPSLDTLAGLADAVGLMPLAVLGGSLLGAGGGAAIGAACGLVGHMRR